MDKTYFIELAEYNLSATNTACSWLEKIGDGQWTQQITSSFDSIQKTVLHIISAESVWVDRFNGGKTSIHPGNNFLASKSNCIQRWKESSNCLLDFVKNIDEAQLNNLFTFTRSNGETSSAKYYEAIAHMINHASYHRGQLVTLLRQTGYTQFQSTDLITYYRSKIKK